MCFLHASGIISPRLRALKSRRSKREQSIKMKRIFYNEELCIGCGLCEIYCLVEHSRSKDIIKANRRETPKPLARVRLEVNLPSTFASRCQHCKDPACVAACLSGAMRKDEGTGVVTHDAEKCIGCWTCIMVCPFGAIKRDTSARKVIAKCDLCSESGTPVCVANCPNEALVYKESPL